MVFEINEHNLNDFFIAYLPWKNTDIIVKQVGYDEMMREDVISFISDSFSQDKSDTKNIIFLQKQLEEKGGTIYQQFIAYQPDSFPVGFGTLMLIPNTNYYKLGGAVTRKDRWNKGVYSAILAHRINAAKDNQKKTIVIEAMKSTSAPILRKYGFESISKIVEYTIKQ